MNIRYSFLNENPPIPPISACISNLKKKVSQLNENRNLYTDIEASSSLKLISYIVDDMKEKMEKIHIDEMDGVDEDLNEDRDDFIKKQVMDARKWLENDIAEDSQKQLSTPLSQIPKSSPDVNHYPKDDWNEALNSNRNGTFPDVDEKLVKWKNNFIGDENTTVTARIVAYNTESEKNGFDRIKKKDNPFEESDLQKFVNRMQQRYEPNIKESQNNTIPLQKSPEIIKYNKSKRSPNPKRKSVSSNKSYQSISKKSVNNSIQKNSEDNQIETKLSPLVAKYRNITRPETRQSPRKAVSYNNFVNEEKTIDPFEYPPENRTSFPKPTELTPPSTPKNGLALEEIVIPPSPVEKESLRKIRPPTRKKGPPTALDLEPPIPVVQFDGNNTKENVAQTDFLPLSKLNDSSKISFDNQEFSGLVKTPTDLLRHPIRGPNPVYESSSFGETQLSKTVNSTQEELIRQAIQLSSIKNGETTLTPYPNNITSPIFSEEKSIEPSKSKTPILVPSPSLIKSPEKEDQRKTTPKRRQGNAGLELAIPIGTPNSGRNSEETSSTADLLSQNPFTNQIQDFNNEEIISKTSTKRKSRSRSVSKSKSRFEGFVTSEDHPNHREYIKEKKKKKLSSKSKKSDLNSELNKYNINNDSGKENKQIKSKKIKVPKYASLDEIPPLPDYVQSPLKHVNLETLQDLVSLTDRLNRGKKTKELMTLLQDVNDLHHKYYNNEDVKF